MPAMPPPPQVPAEGGLPARNTPDRPVRRPVWGIVTGLQAIEASTNTVSYKITLTIREAN